MRAIKFRAWDKEQKQWRYSTDNDRSAYFWQFVDDYLDSETLKTLTQFTGLKDKHGKEIYEGDIVERVFLHPVSGPYKQRAKVIWSGVRWWLEHLDIKPDGRIQADWLENRWVADCEVIGNIYGNPDLLQ